MGNLKFGKKRKLIPLKKSEEPNIAIVECKCGAVLYETEIEEHLILCLESEVNELKEIKP